MTYQEICENARKTILNCRACPECNGLGCGNTLPGPGSKAPGNGANVNWQAWKKIRLNFDTFAEDFQQIAMNAAMSALQAELNTSEGDLANVDLSALLGGNTTWTE